MYAAGSVVVLKNFAAIVDASYFCITLDKLYAARRSFRSNMSDSMWVSTLANSTKSAQPTLFIDHHEIREQQQPLDVRLGQRVTSRQ